MPTANSPKSFSKIIQSFLFGLYRDPCFHEMPVFLYQQWRSHVPQFIFFPLCRKSPWSDAQGENELTVRTHGKGQQQPGLHWEGCGHQVMKGDLSHLHSSVGTGFSLGLPSMRYGCIRNRLTNSKVQDVHKIGIMQ